MNAAREQAERTADRVRTELLSTLQELARRRHRALRLRHQVEKHFPVLLAIAAGVGLVAGGALFLAVMRARARRENLVAELARGFIRAWNSSRRISDTDASPGIAAREVVIALAVVLAAQLAQRGAQRLLPPS